jgi:hypothetical protein
MNAGIQPSSEGSIAFTGLVRRSYGWHRSRWVSPSGQCRFGRPDICLHAPAAPATGGHMWTVARSRVAGLHLVTWWGVHDLPPDSRHIRRAARHPPSTLRQNGRVGQAQCARLMRTILYEVPIGDPPHARPLAPGDPGTPRPRRCIRRHMSDTAPALAAGRPDGCAGRGRVESIECRRGTYVACAGRGIARCRTAQRKSQAGMCRSIVRMRCAHCAWPMHPSCRRVNDGQRSVPPTPRRMAPNTVIRTDR